MMFTIYPVDHYIYQRHVDKVIQTKNKKTVTRTNAVRKINDTLNFQQNREKNRLELEKGTIIDVKI
ncbi:hypothetical protein [Pallidibacillus pasinlerensis]|uniref:Uncharacterized protein n=1 Tax=Pallidibacillus pasinlerensis TaxID=2703818 RepID=A0ABX0A6G3_9BACI|nr:hypothetical protein [Pallidibacillus pasinlerensis]NCU18377.1 hypothetical protein [Pallidibacillus pasinlerensis]